MTIASDVVVGEVRDKAVPCGLLRGIARNMDTILVGSFVD